MSSYHNIRSGGGNDLRDRQTILCDDVNYNGGPDEMATMSDYGAPEGYSEAMHDMDYTIKNLREANLSDNRNILRSVEKNYRAWTTTVSFILGLEVIIYTFMHVFSAWEMLSAYGLFLYHLPTLLYVFFVFVIMRDIGENQTKRAMSKTVLMVFAISILSFALFGSIMYTIKTTETFIMCNGISAGTYTPISPTSVSAIIGVESAIMCSSDNWIPFLITSITGNMITVLRIAALFVICIIAYRTEGLTNMRMRVSLIENFKSKRKDGGSISVEQGSKRIANAMLACIEHGGDMNVVTADDSVVRRKFNRYAKYNNGRTARTFYRR